MCVCINADIAIIFPLSFTTAVSRVLNLFQLVLMERSISGSFEPDAWVPAINSYLSELQPRPDKDWILQMSQ